MNGRIKERLIEAGVYTVVNGNAYPTAMSGEESEAAMEYFTQLIVKDCMSMIRIVGRLCDSKTSAEESLDFAEKNIGAYFGVK